MNLLYFWRQLSLKTRKSYIFLFLMSLLSVVCEVLVLSAVGYLTGVLEKPNKDEIKIYLFFGKIEFTLTDLFLGFIVLVIVSFLLKFLILRIGTKLAFIAGNDIGVKLFRIVLKKDYITHLNRGDKEFLDLMTSKINMLVNGVFRPAFSFLVNIFLLISIVISLIYIISLSFVLLLFTIMIFFGLSFALSKGTIEKNGIKIKDFGEKRTLTVQQGLMSIKEIKIYNLFDFFVKNFKNSDLKFRLAQAENSFLSILPKYVLESLSLVGFGLFLLYGNYEDLLSFIPQIAVLGVGFQKSVPAFQAVFQSINTMQGYKEISDSICNEMSFEFNETNNSLELISNQELAVSNLSFSYNSSHELFFKDLVFKKGYSYRLRGESGSGKSTFVNLFTGLLSPNQGIIESNQIVLNNDCRLRLASYVSQNFIIPSEDVAECFRLYNPNINKTEIEDLITLVELVDVIKYTSKIGLNGSLLSGGQRQRMGIALALASERQILILDEATTGLEPSLENRILNRIRERFCDNVLIIISHSEAVLSIVDFEINVTKS